MSRWTRRAFLVLAGTGTAAFRFRPLGAIARDDAWLAVLLGSIQDGGLPQAGCYTNRCERARHDSHHVASLCIVSPDTGRAWLVDASPDLVRQMDLIPGAAFRRRASERRPFEGILLTHAHIGHYLGLAMLGREGLAIQTTPCYCSARMARFLADNGPWSLLVEEGHLDLRVLQPDVPVRLAADLDVTALEVPHRDEFSDTLGFVFRGPRGSLLYLPDIDRWDRWERRIEDVVATVDVALIDATFYSSEEVAGRSQSEIPHPSNPILDPGGPERRSVTEAGFGIARAGLSYRL